jgi:membrane-associated protein
MTGDHLVYAVARHRLPSVLDRSRLGRRLQRNAERAYGRIESVSTVTLAMARFIPFGRTAAAATAGLVGVPPRRYVWISLLGASTWAAWMVGLGYVVGDTTDGPIWLQVGIAVLVGFVVAAALAGVQQAVTRRRTTSIASGESKDAEGSEGSAALTLVR